MFSCPAFHVGFCASNFSLICCQVNAVWAQRFCKSADTMIAALRIRGPRRRRDLASKLKSNTGPRRKPVIFNPNSLSFDCRSINSVVLRAGLAIFRLKPLAGPPIRPTIYNMVSPKTSRSPREQTDHQRIRLVLLDGHVLFRESLARLL